MIPNIGRISATADLDDLTAVTQVDQRPLNGNLADIGALFHNLCFGYFPNGVFYYFSDTCRLGKIVFDLIKSTLELSVSCQKNTQKITNKRRVVVFTFVPT